MSKQPTTEPTLYERIGPEATGAAVFLLYEQLLEDELITPFFEGVSLEKQYAKQMAFLSMALGGPIAYTEKSLREVHGPLVERGLDDTIFDRLLDCLRRALDELGVDTPTQDEVIAVVNGYRDDILCR